LVENDVNKEYLKMKDKHQLSETGT